jgi:uncharacterized protein YqhQ
LPETFHYGGQAVIGGVMMRGQKNLAIAVRRPNGELVLSTKPLPNIYTGTIRKIPLVRGIIVLVETMILGIQTLMYSANVSLEEEEQEISSPMMWGLLVVSLAFAVGLFFVTPLLLVNFLDQYLTSSLVSNIVEGIIRIAIFVLYLGVMNLIPEVRKVFAYHGAEHKTVNAHESGAPLEVEPVRKYSTAHTRCGTSFLLVVLVIAIVVFALLGQPAMWVRILSRIILVPVIAAIGYEIVRLGATYAKNTVVRFLLAPGLALQALTTRQPDDAQLETAISALRGVIEADRPETLAQTVSD